jgi:hypothetical protein
MNKMNPVFSLGQVIKYALTGRLSFPRGLVGKKFVMEGEKWLIFRQVIVKSGKNQPAVPGAIFVPKFHVANMSVRQNIRFSLLPMWFIIGLPGFRSKLWMYNPQNGDSAGFYEWDTVQDAENYSKSFAAGFMTKRSVPGSVSFKIIPK